MCLHHFSEMSKGVDKEKDWDKEETEHTAYRNPTHKFMGDLVANEKASGEDEQKANEDTPAGLKKSVAGA